MDEDDRRILNQFVGEFVGHFGYGAEAILEHKFIKRSPRCLRLYGQLYAY